MTVLVADGAVFVGVRLTATGWLCELCHDHRCAHVAAATYLTSHTTREDHQP